MRLPERNYRQPALPRSSLAPPCSRERQLAGGARRAGPAAHLPAAAAVQGGHGGDAAAQVGAAGNARTLSAQAGSRDPGACLLGRRPGRIPMFAMAPPPCHVTILASCAPQPEADHRAEPQCGLGAGRAHRLRGRARPPAGRRFAMHQPARCTVPRPAAAALALGCRLMLPSGSPPPSPAQLLALLKSSAPYVRSEADWRTVCAIIKLTSGGACSSAEQMGAQAHWRPSRSSGSFALPVPGNVYPHQLAASALLGSPRALVHPAPAGPDRPASSTPAAPPLQCAPRRRRWPTSRCRWCAATRARCRERATCRCWRRACSTLNGTSRWAGGVVAQKAQCLLCRAEAGRGVTRQLSRHVWDEARPGRAHCMHLRDAQPPCFSARSAQQNVEAAVRFLDLIELLFNWLVTQSQHGSPGRGLDEEPALSGGPSSGVQHPP